MLGIFDILVRIRISVPLTYGSGSGPAPDKDPALFVSVFQDANTKKFLFLKVVTKEWQSRIFLLLQ